MRKISVVVLASVLWFTGYASAQIKQNFTVTGDHGKLAAVLQAPEGKKTYPLVIILHGFNGHKQMPLLTELARQLNERGIGAVLFDFNGQGESEGSFLDMTIPNEMEDARRVYAHISKWPQVTAIGMVGHSMGGIETSMLAAELGADKIKAIALMAPAGELPDDVRGGELFGTKFDPQNVPEYIQIFTGLKIGRAFLETTQTVPVYEASAGYTGPVLIVHSQDDELVPYKYGKRYLQIYPQAQLETLHGIDHSFTQDTPGVDKIVVDFFAKQLLENN